MFQYEIVDMCVSPPDGIEFTSIELGNLDQDIEDLGGIAWKNVSRTVCLNGSDPILLLSNNTGVCKRGEIMAIMGISGNQLNLSFI
jgi:hypothetical protein